MQEGYTPSRAVIYVRISDDKEGAGAGVGRQIEDSQALAERLGWGVLEVLDENDTSAFKRRRVKRPNGTTELRVVRPKFRRVIELIESGAADGLVAYDLDRTARDPRDLEDLIDAVEQRTPRVPVRSVTGSLRLDNDADVTMARVMVAVANKSSRDTQRRVARKHDEIARSGRYAGGGARRYGYEADGTTVNEAEAAVIREAVERTLAGESVNSICRDLNQRGVKPVKAQTWSTNTLIGIFRSGRIAGLRVHRGEIIGPAAWPAIIDPATRDELLACLAGASHGRGKAALRYWCNRVLWCGRCGEPLTGALLSKSAGRRHRYWCATNRVKPGCGRVAISSAVEDEVRDQVLAFLARPDVLTALNAGSNRVAVDETRRLLDDDRAQLTELARAHGNKQISMAEWLEARAPIDQRVKTYEKALRATAPMAARAMLTEADPAAAWGAMSAEGRRQVARDILEVGGYKGWVVAPADLRGPRRFDPNRLSLIEADA